MDAGLRDVDFERGRGRGVSEHWDVFALVALDVETRTQV